MPTRSPITTCTQDAEGMSSASVDMMFQLLVQRPQLPQQLKAIQGSEVGIRIGSVLYPQLAANASEANVGLRQGPLQSGFEMISCLFDTRSRVCAPSPMARPLFESNDSKDTQPLTSLVEREPTISAVSGEEQKTSSKCLRTGPCKHAWWVYLGGGPEALHYESVLKGRPANSPGCFLASQ
jgi:hypothetical protein